MKSILDWLMLSIIPLMMITKVIHAPIKLNFSPADILIIAIGAILFVKFISQKFLRNIILKEKVIYIFLGIIIIRFISSLCSYQLNVVTLSFLGAGIANLKFIISFIYFLIGFLIIQFLNEKRVLSWIYISSCLFVIIGLFGQLIFVSKWATVNSRMVSLSNDPNVAGLIILIGFIAGIKLIYRENTQIVKIIIGLSFIAHFYALILTGSRTALLAFGLLILVNLILISKNLASALLIFSISMLMIMNVLFIDNRYFQSQGYDYIVNRLEISSHNAFESRKELLMFAKEMGKNNTLIGIGTGNFILNLELYSEKLKIKLDHKQVAHNTFYSFYAENGVFAMILYILLMIYLVYRARNPFAWMFFLVLITYSIFFNVENIRILWFNYGVFLNSGMDHFKIKNPISTKKTIFISIICIILSLIMMPTLTKPYVAEGQSIFFDAKDHVALYIEMVSEEDAILNISLNGPSKKELNIKNDLGVFYGDLSLEPGEYEMQIDSLGSEIDILRFDLLTDKEHSIVNEIFSFNELSLVSLKKPRKVDVVSVLNKYDLNAKYQDEPVLYGNEVKGVNFHNQILLKSSQYIHNSDNTITARLQFVKIGVIDEEYVLLMRAAAVNQTSFDEVGLLSKNYDFDLSLRDLEVGSEFMAEWTFNTQDNYHLVYYGFYHKDKVNGNVIIPYPISFKEGLVK